MDDLDSLVNKSKLPSQLKEYFTSSTRIKEIVNVDTIKEIEDLYIFYNSLYIFDTSEFSAYTVTSIKRCKDLKSFYFYLKKVIDTNMELKSKDTRKSRQEFYINGKPINMSFRETITEFCLLIDKIHKGEKDINLYQTYISLGKMELINILIADDHHKHISTLGRKYLKTILKITNNYCASSYSLFQIY